MIEVDLINDGILWMINRTIFHPRGYALAIDDDGDFFMLGDGQEVWTFEPDDEKFEAFLSLLDRLKKQ